ncbi:hypothetical protein MJO28_002344 [Puccinia striiformis f. sp. tritici]|uniref:Mitotic-spindle organizing protein 1 n=4 Tax=Puccinia striiformis TaxID=27350 RepID=A0A0L0VC96_9BASI|nr:uncharacterized protein Pst134EA_032320 [Puccinia striiformis f. sp. tritici]XP_047811271.1 hypothetical protein Pst134EA_002455 [Puccinia striiformis f. sp. tritici]KAI9609876.1 hypothetical protein H4Q26_006865 [Puccinia striiformis f. sp. tritici PST-130]KNE96900.1 hypothetical protein PSTG_09884 [Puccinia striiformis f. sp. tritici PST-78]POW07491.1 hypothetical protein PSTT_08240 [Puccinia striiformis]KAH9440618.1 hypothetical protein Pst134EA_032320 [Puccinia striiformis f. sp. tritic
MNHPTSANTETKTARTARDAIEVLHEISELLGTGLDQQTLALCVGMIEEGTNPLALAQVVQELRQEVKGKSKSNPTFLP